MVHHKLAREENEKAGFQDWATRWAHQKPTTTGGQAGFARPESLE